MSEKHPTIHEQWQIMHHCRKCQAEPGQWCRTKRGGPTVFLHVVRGS